MKRILFFILVISVSSSKGQGIDSTGYYTQMNSLFSLIDKNQITSGFLQDYAIELNNWDNFKVSIDSK